MTLTNEQRSMIWAHAYIAATTNDLAGEHAIYFANKAVVAADGYAATLSDELETESLQLSESGVVDQDKGSHDIGRYHIVDANEKVEFEVGGTCDRGRILDVFCNSDRSLSYLLSTGHQWFEVPASGITNYKPPAKIKAWVVKNPSEDVGQITFTEKTARLARELYENRGDLPQVIAGYWTQEVSK